MKLGSLVFAAFVVILVACFSYPVAESYRMVRIAYLESAEEPLIDTANVLAELVGDALARDSLDVDRLYGVAARTRTRVVGARVYSTLKDRVDLDVYITDDRGIVIFDSRGRATVGQDYARWRDVRRTLAGEYGARVSHPDRPSTLYVAAPIRVRGEIVGALTVIKPTTSVGRFLERSRPRLIAMITLAAGAALLLMSVVALWVHQQVGRLTRYADAVREGLRVPFPALAPTELRHMGLAFDRMRASLDGHAYIENYVRGLTHELKSPLSAIRGAAEILESPTLEPAQRDRFFRNLQGETRRIEDLVDRMLELSELEARRALPTLEPVLFAPIVRTILEAQEPALRQRELRVVNTVPEDLAALGDGFLLHLAVSNLIKNAIEWSPRGGTIRVGAGREDGAVEITVDDEGPGIPEFARERVFERFYSLERPDTGRKSTGLGLTFVREIAELHRGTVALDARRHGGTQARLRLNAPEPATTQGGA